MYIYIYIYICYSFSYMFLYFVYISLFVFFMVLFVFVCFRQRKLGSRQALAHLSLAKKAVLYVFIEGIVKGLYTVFKVFPKKNVSPPPRERERDR